MIKKNLKLLKYEIFFKKRNRFDRWFVLNRQQQKHETDWKLKAKRRDRKKCQNLFYLLILQI